MFLNMNRATLDVHTMVFVTLRIVALACLAISGLASAQPSAQYEARETYSPSSEGLDDGADEQLDGSARNDSPSQGPRVILNHSLQHEFTVPNPLERVTVRGRMPPSAYRRRVEAAVEGTWDAFNAVNSDDQFDVSCRYETPTGSRIPQHICRPQFLDNATSRAAEAFLQLDKGGSIGLQQIEAGRAHYMERRLRDEFRSLATSQAELGKQAEILNERLEDYEEARATDSE